MDLEKSQSQSQSQSQSLIWRHQSTTQSGSAKWVRMWLKVGQRTTHIHYLQFVRIFFRPKFLVNNVNWKNSGIDISMFFVNLLPQKQVLIYQNYYYYLKSSFHLFIQKPDLLSRKYDRGGADVFENQDSLT